MANLRKIIAIALLFGIFSNSFNYWLLSYAYAINKEYIASVLCTNKNNPHLHCDGKCFVDIKMKELDQKHKHDQENLQKLIETVAPPVSLEANLVFEFHQKQQRLPFNSGKPINITTTVFQPPKTA